MEYQHACGTSKTETIATLVNKCSVLEPNDHLVVFDFGKNRDLRLDIYKDEDYNKERGEYNLVVVHTSQLKGNVMSNVDDTEDVYVGNGELDKELERIYAYKDFALIY